MEKNKNIIWTKEQNEIISNMIKESENIGYVEGHDEAVKEIIQKLENFILSIKNKFYKRQK